MNKIYEYLNELNSVSIFLRLTIAVVCAGIIGYGREREKRPAGLRTHILVSIGATLAMITNIYIYENLEMAIDPTRLGAQVISGIGFLGAGTIIITGKNKVKGLTTAAGLWACACMGLAIGAGFYQGAIIGCIFICIVTVVLSKFDERINNNSTNMTLYLLVKSPKVATKILVDMQNKDIKITDIEISNNNVSSNELIGMVLGIKISKKICHKTFLETINDKDEVIFLQEIS